MKKIVILISGRGSNMEALIAARDAGQLPVDIAAVISNRPDAMGLETAARAGITAHFIDHKAFAGREAFDAAFFARVDAVRPDLVVCAGYMRILGSAFVSRFEGRLLNVHPSLLPRHKGLHTHARALEAGDAEHGASVHFVVPELDAGAVVAQATIPIGDGDSPQALAERLLPLEHQLVVATLALAGTGRLTERNGQAWLDGHPLLNPLRLDSSGQLSPDLQQR